MVIGQRLKEPVAIGLIGDGVLVAIAPRRHPRLCLPGPPGYQHTLQALRDRPMLKRLLGIAQVALGLWLAARQWHSSDTSLYDEGQQISLLDRSEMLMVRVLRSEPWLILRLLAQAVSTIVALGGAIWLGSSPTQ